MKRCGKRNCRCARGALHRAYYRFWRDRRGRQHKEYVRGRDVERVRAACAAWRAMDEAMQQITSGAETKALKRQFRADLRRMGMPPEIIRQYR